MKYEEFFKLRSYKSSDLDEVLERIVSEKYLNKYLNNLVQYRILNFLKLHKSFFYVLENYEGQIVACVVIRCKFNIKHFKNTFWLYGIEVLMEQRGKGIGTVLVLKIMEILRISGVNRVFLKVHTENLPALKMYEKLGFKKDSICGKYLIMSAIL